MHCAQQSCSRRAQLSMYEQVQTIKCRLWQIVSALNVSGGRSRKWCLGRPRSCASLDFHFAIMKLQSFKLYFNDMTRNKQSECGKVALNSWQTIGIRKGWSEFFCWVKQPVTLSNYLIDATVGIL